MKSVFYVQIWYKCETPLLFFLIKTMVYSENSIESFFSVQIWRHMQFGTWNNGGNDVYKNIVWKNSFLKINFT